jgi:hypothetical protein
MAILAPSSIIPTVSHHNFFHSPFRRWAALPSPFDAPIAMINNWSARCIRIPKGLVITASLMACSVYSHPPFPFLLGMSMLLLPGRRPSCRFSAIAFIVQKATKDVYSTPILRHNANVVISFNWHVLSNYHLKAAVMIWSHQLVMLTIRTGYLPMRTRVFNIIIVMMVIAATVALVRSMLTI